MPLTFTMYREEEVTLEEKKNKSLKTGKDFSGTKCFVSVCVI